MPVGVCKLCLEEKDLVRSHLMPHALYDLMRNEESEPIRFTSEYAMATSRQTRDHLLCLGCEDILNNGGETWVLPKLATMAGEFPFYDIVKSTSPMWEEPDMTPYRGTGLPDCGADKITHFAAGIFWKACVHSWSGNTEEPRIELGPYAEALRKFIRGETAFPNNVALTVLVSSPELVDISMLDPYEGVKTEWRTFFTYVPGILFALHTGKLIPDETITTAITTLPDRPILFSLEMAKAVRLHFAKAWHKAPKSRQLLAAMEKRREAWKLKESLRP
jgi:hypothetical protein